MTLKGKPQNYLPPDALWRIATAGPEERPADLAREIGRPYFTIAKALQRIRREGWICQLHWTTCAVCGKPLAHGTPKRVVHPACKAERVRRQARESRKRHPGQSTPYVQRYLADHPEKVVEKRKAGLAYQREQMKKLSPTEMQALLEKAHKADIRDQELTAEVAGFSGDRWTGDEDEYVLDHLFDPAREVGLRLGRTLYSVRNRRVWLRRALGIPVKRSRYE